MMAALKDWILTLTVAALVSSIAMTLSPEGKVRRVVSLVCGLVTIIALLSPGVNFDISKFAKQSLELKKEAENFASDFEDKNDNLRRLIIEEECAAYILDKGQMLGILNITASVNAKWDTDGFWYPYSAEIVSDADAENKRRLAQHLEAELGISDAMQTWRTYDEKW